MQLQVELGAFQTVPGLRWLEDSEPGQSQSSEGLAKITTLRHHCRVAGMFVHFRMASVSCINETL